MSELNAEISAMDREVGLGRLRRAGSRVAGVRELGLSLIILAVGGILSFASPAFLTQSNLTAVGIGLVTDGVIAIAMTVLLIAGGFDLSVGSGLALGGVLCALMLTNGFPIPVAILLTLAAGAVVGTTNGLIVTKIGVNPLIATLGMMTIASSLTLVISGGYPLSRLPKDFRWLGQGRLGTIHVAIIFLLLLIVVGDLVVRQSRPARLIYYVGSNRAAAALSGIPVDRVLIGAYVLTGIAAALAGVIATSRLSSAFPQAGIGTELRVISACVIGGCSLSGGEGSISGSALGVLLLALISNGLILLSVNVSWQGIVTGLILIGAVAFDRLNRMRRAA